MFGLYLLLAPPVLADGPARAATATAHAQAELANALAQGKITAVPTPTFAPTATAAPSATTVVVATATPEPTETPAPTPVPALPVTSPGGNPVGGYLRPSIGDGSPLLELALRQGRWDVDLGEGACGLLGPWSNVWMLTLQEGLVVLAGKEYFAELDESLTCAIASAAWRAVTPCAQDEDGRCDVLADGGYWEAFAEDQAAEPERQATEVVPPEPTPRVVTVVVTRVVQAPPQVVYRDSPPPPPEVVQVVSTVLVLAPTPTPFVAPSPTATRTPAPRPTPTQTAMPTARVAPEPSPTPEPVLAATQANSRLSGGIGLGLAGLAAVAAMLWQRSRGERDD